MKNIRVQIFLLSILVIQQSWSQSNTFPTSGNVGIGVTNPLAKLSVDGFVKVEGADGRLMLQNPSATGSIYLRNSGSSSQRKLEILYGSSSKFVMDNNGNVGVGVTNPLAKLSVDGFIKIEGADGRLMLQNPGATGSIYLRNSGTSSQRKFEILYGGTTQYVMDNNGNVGIGTTNPLSKLAVNGNIRATEVKVLTDISVPDYVFEPDYELRTLKETKEYIIENKHLPEIPSASEIGENGIDLGDMNMKLLKKIEELTLYQIELLERLEKAEEKIQILENK